MKNQKTIIIAVIILFVLWLVYKQSMLKPIPSQGNPNIISGCTNPIATNYNPIATLEDGSCILGYQGCCDTQGTNYDSGCSSDPACQCSQSLCNMLSGRTGCCDSTTLEYDPSCLGDSNCACDQSLCGDPVGQGGRTACCTIGANNYDSSCSGDPFCSCDTTLCQFPQSSHTCYTGCIGTGFQSMYTTEPCGSGYASNFPNVNPPADCGGSQG